MERILWDALSLYHSFICHLVIHLFSQNLLVPSVHCAGQGCGWPSAHLELGTTDGLRGSSGLGFDRRLLGAIWRIVGSRSRGRLATLVEGRTRVQVLGVCWPGRDRHGEMS